MDMINCKVNGIAVSVPKGSTILEAARAAGVEIPTLCFMKEKNEIGACRICVVEATGARGLVTACVYPAAEGMEIRTNTQKVQQARKTTLELMLSTHDKKCLSCVRSTNCELQKLCREYGVDETAFEGYKPHYELDESTPHLVRNNNKCILCRRCVAACAEQYVSVIGANNRGIDTSIGCAFNLQLSQVPCISCGQCIGRLPDRRARRKRRHRQSLGSAGRPDQARRGTDRAVDPRHAGRMLRHGNRHQCRRQDGRRAAPSGLRQSVRHRLRSRPDHRGRGQRAGASGCRTAARCR